MLPTLLVIQAMLGFAGLGVAQWLNQEKAAQAGQKRLQPRAETPLASDAWHAQQAGFSPRDQLGGKGFTDCNPTSCSSIFPMA